MKPKESNMSLVEFKQVTKRYGNFTALENIDLTLERGRIIGLLGRNGAGKSTLMRSLLGFLKYDGEITFDGRPVKAWGQRIFERIGFIPDVSTLDNRLTVRQTMKYVAGVNPSWRQEKADKLLTISELPLNKRVGNLSKGMKTKLYLLVILSLDVDFLLLDEPTIGLDIAFRKEFFNTILGDYFDETKTILISTHQVEEVEHILQDIIFLHEGKIKLHEDIDALKERFVNIRVPLERKDELMAYHPRQVTQLLGAISAIVPAEVKIEGAEYQRPMLSDLFMSEMGGTNE
jgi:ABC-2 type transport system ATP-binding protein